MFSNDKKKFTILFLLIFFLPENVFAMHIMEGFLPAGWCIAWALTVIPFLIVGLYLINKKTKGNPKIKILLGVAGAFVFVLSADFTLRLLLHFEIRRYYLLLVLLDKW